MKLGRLAKGVVVAAMASVALSACTAESTGIVENTSITVAWNQPFYSFNQNTTNGNATANANVLYLTQQSFNYYNDKQELIRNEEFGTYELLSEDPLTVKYTINEGVTWSDGVPVDAADLLLHWAALSGNVNDPDAEPEYDAETGQVIPGDFVYFDSVAIGGGIEQVTQTPVIGDDGRSITLVYDQILVDWELLYTSAGVPAHVVAAHALGIEDPSEAKAAVIDAIENKDAAALKPLADFWNTGFDYETMPEDADIVTGNGAYIVTDFTNEYITLTARGAGYTAGPQPKIETVTVRFIPDALASVQALQNGEVKITLPQATTDVLEAAKAIDGVTINNESEAVYEHIDLVFDKEGGAFNPATYGGDEDIARTVRAAFMTAIDVNEVIDKLIKPLNPDAEWDQSQVFLPGAPGYEESIANNGSAAYGQGDAAAAKAMLESVGLTDPIDVCFLFSSTNTRRVNEYQLYAEQVAPAGFNLVDCSSESWGSLLGSGTYDASLFGWQSTSTAVTASDPTFRTGAGNNLTGYGNPAVDALYDELKTEFDKDRQIAILQEIDKILWDDAYGMTVFQFPGVLMYSDDVQNVSSSPLSPQFFWNYWEWEVPAPTE